MLRKLVRAYGSSGLAEWRPDNDLPDFVDAVGWQRSRGVDTGRMVRLLGTILRDLAGHFFAAKA